MGSVTGAVIGSTMGVTGGYMSGNAIIQAGYPEACGYINGAVVATTTTFAVDAIVTGAIDKRIPPFDKAADFVE